MFERILVRFLPETVVLNDNSYPSMYVLSEIMSDTGDLRSGKKGNLSRLNTILGPCFFCCLRCIALKRCLRHLESGSDS